MFQPQEKEPGIISSDNMTLPKGASWAESRGKMKGLPAVFGKNLKPEDGKADTQTLPEVGGVQQQIRK